MGLTISTYRGQHACGWTARKLDHVQFLPVADDDAFAFMDPFTSSISEAVI